MFPLLKLALLAQFRDLPRPRLIRDLLAPLKNAAGNSYKHGNRRDRAKSISIEIVLTRKGGLIAISDEGPGFDVPAELQRMRQEPDPDSDRGAGFRNLERAHSLVSLESGGHTVLLCFRPDVEEPDSGSPDVPPFSYESGSTAAAPTIDVGTAPLRNACDLGWMQSSLAEAPPGLLGDNTEVQVCSIHPALGRASDGCGIRYLVQLGRSPERRVITGRLHADGQAAADDFEAARKLYAVVSSKQLRIPRPLGRRTCDGRLVLYDFDPWLSGWEYISSRGASRVLVNFAERIGRGLAELHRSDIVLPQESLPEIAGRVRNMCARLERKCAALDPSPELMRRFSAALQRTQVRFETARPRALAPTHGGPGWHCIHYGVDSFFDLYRFERCRLSDPAIDLGAFLADVLLFVVSQRSEDRARQCIETFLSSYRDSAGDCPTEDRLRAYISVSVLSRLERSLLGSQPTPGIGFVLDVLDSL